MGEPVSGYPPIVGGRREGKSPALLTHHGSASRV